MSAVQPAAAPGVAQQPVSILVVDDNPAKRLALSAMLTPLGHTIVEADSGRAALRGVLATNFAMILMDVRMPTMDGYETARLIRQRRGSMHTPIIFATAFDDDMAIAAAYASGAVDFIFTPILPEVLRAKATVFVDLFLQAQEAQRALASITSLNAALRDSEVRTQAVLDNVADGIFILDDRGVIESVNHSVERLFGYSSDEPVGKPFAFVIAPECRDRFCGLDDAPLELAGPGSPHHPTETFGRRRDGSTFAMEVESGVVVHDTRRLTLAFVRDVSERKAHTAALERLALHDGITGLANRALFSNHVLRALATARRAGEPRAVLLMNLDGFKQINEALGHEKGDRVLSAVGERLTRAVHETGTVARLAGDEFAILPDGATDLVAAAAVAWAIQQACEPEIVIDDMVVHVSPSVGIALYPEHGDTASQLLRRADLAMHEAKRSGGGHAVFDGAQEQQLAHHLALLGDLRQCVARDELVLHYQPKIDLATGELAGVEALLRWRHPHHGLLLPGGFIPELERIQLITPVTRWVLNEALRQQRAWSDIGLDLTMAVNISGNSLHLTSALPEVVAELTETWGTPPDKLTLELTESALIEAGAPDVLTRLHASGIQVSIDDFGTGYSSLAYVQRLPVDEIKIDRSFVTNLIAASNDEVIVRSIIDLAHNLGLTVVAEGVEDATVLAMLVAYECDSAQGYFISRPCAPDELTAWLAESAYVARARTTKTGQANGRVKGPVGPDFTAALAGRSRPR